MYFILFFQGYPMKVICSTESVRLLTGILVDDDCDGGMPYNGASDDSKLGWSCLTEDSNSGKCHSFKIG